MTLKQRRGYQWRNKKIEKKTANSWRCLHMGLKGSQSDPQTVREKPEASRVMKAKENFQEAKFV